MHGSNRHLSAQLRKRGFTPANESGIIRQSLHTFSFDNAAPEVVVLALLGTDDDPADAVVDGVNAADCDRKYRTTSSLPQRAASLLNRAGDVQTQA